MHAGAKVPVPVGLGMFRAAGRELRWLEEPWERREFGGRRGRRRTRKATELGCRGFFLQKKQLPGVASPAQG